MRFANKLGFYELNPFPGSNQIAVSNHAFIYPQYRGKGYGQIQHRERLLKAKELGYDLLICTCLETNYVEKHILNKNFWTPGPLFTSTETGHNVRVWSKYLSQVT